MVPAPSRRDSADLTSNLSLRQHAHWTELPNEIARSLAAQDDTATQPSSCPADTTAFTKTTRGRW